MRERVEQKWEGMKIRLLGTAALLVGRTSGALARGGDEWWWDEELQNILTRKAIAFKEWKVNNSVEARERCREINRGECSCETGYGGNRSGVVQESGDCGW